jgi:diaminopimelate decarboxylase
MDLSRLSDFAEQYGSPLFVYDGQRLKENVDQLRSCFKTDALDIHYACKALTNRSILKLLHSYGCGIDAVSIFEMQAALSAGIPASEINFTPSGAELSEYRFAIDHDISLHVDNAGKLEILAGEYANLRVALRFNPDVRAGGHARLEVGAGDSKFGLYPEELPEVKRIVGEYGVQVTGVHCHVGSDIADEAYFIRAFDFLISVSEHFSEHLEFIDFGGGFKVRYKESDHPTDMTRVGKSVTKLFTKFCETLGRELRLVIEPGKSLVSDAGYFIVRVTALKQTNRREIAYVNSGFNHLIRPMYYDAYHHIVNLSNPEGKLKSYKVAGYLCETDTFAMGRSINEIRVGDYLCFHNAGAYTMSMASNYNLRPRPAEILIENGQGRLIRRAETLEDLLAAEVFDEG